MEKIDKKSNWGGRREGSGRPPGKTKIKLSVSVDRRIFHRAARQWGNKPSRLVEMLLDRYASNNI